MDHHQTARIALRWALLPAAFSILWLGLLALPSSAQIPDVGSDLLPVAPPVEVPVTVPKVELPPLPLPDRAPVTSAPSTRPADQAQPAEVGGVAPAVPASPATPRPTTAPTQSPASAPPASQPRTVNPDLARNAATAAVETGRAFWLPLAVGGMISLFLFLQGRIDRRDPKLAAAPVTEEVLAFS